MSDRMMKRSDGIKMSVIYLDTLLRHLEQPLFDVSKARKRTSQDEDDEREREKQRQKSASNTDAPKPKMFDIISERPYPFPCPFLYTPKGLFQHRWAPNQRERVENGTIAAELTDRMRSPSPPCELRAPPKTSSSSDNPILDPVNFKHGAKEMYSLDLYAQPAALAQVYTVLQGEIGLAVYSPPPREPTEEKEKEGSSCPPLYLLSPDATSCVIVACRARLNPNLKWCAIEGVDDSFSRNVFHLLQSTITAAMGHFDRVEGLTECLFEMLYDTTLPAWLHAVVEGYKECKKDAVSADSDTTLLREVLHWIGEFNKASVEWIQVEWYVVGGIRMERQEAPELETIWKTFFPPTGSQAPVLLAKAIPLSRLLADWEDEEGGEEVTLPLRHRLQEDGVCCWSFNTFMGPWKGETKNMNKRYAHAACFGLLLQVSPGPLDEEEGGYCWPAQVAAGRRGYPLSEIRGIIIQDYRWLCPLEKEVSAVPGPEGEEEEGAATPLQVVINTIQTSKMASIAAKKHSPFLKLELSTVEDKETPPEIVPLTLKIFVQYFIAALREYRSLCKANPNHNNNNNNNRFLHAIPPLPLLIRRHKECVKGSREEGPLEWFQGDYGDAKNQPDDTFLAFSTTPHCEPEDFASLLRSHFLIRTEGDAADFYVRGTDGLLLV